MSHEAPQDREPTPRPTSWSDSSFNYGDRYYLSLPPQDGKSNRRGAYAPLREGIIPLILRRGFRSRLLEGHFDSKGVPVLHVSKPKEVFKSLSSKHEKAIHFLADAGIHYLRMSGDVTPNEGHYESAERWHPVDRNDAPIYEELPPIAVLRRHLYITQVDVATWLPAIGLTTPGLRVSQRADQDGLDLRFVS